MSSKEIRQLFIDYFKSKGHIVVPSSSLLPEDDPTVLLTSAGMQQFVQYLSGKKDPVKDFGAKELTSCQKCFRMADIDDVGDDVHHTFFEMLGNWSIGGKYFKEKAINYAFEFVTKRLKLKKDRLWITIFRGSRLIPKDIKSKKIWLKIGIPKKRIKSFGLKDNFWGPVASEGPCGPCSEIHYDRGRKYGCGRSDCGPNCPKCNRFVEIWNLVFMEYFKAEDGTYEPLPKKNVDTGAGLERLTAILNKKPSAYETDLFWPVILKLKELTGLKYKKHERHFRIIADHLRGAVFLIADGVIPSNLEEGYILRRVIRKVIRYVKLFNLGTVEILELAKIFIDIYDEVYPELSTKKEQILTVIQNEAEKFEKTLRGGLKYFEKVAAGSRGEISGKEAFRLYDTYGLPLEMTEELASERKLKVDKKGFKKEFERHQKISRAGAEKKFGGVGKKAGRKETKYHTATHLLHAALRKVLGDHVKQMGSDITAERLRFDFSHPKKLTDEEKKKVEKLVNEVIKKDLKVSCQQEVPYKEALEKGALAFFKDKYPEKVSVYTIGDPANPFSKEVCAGPHVKHTGILGKFKIISEKSSSGGIRRIKAVLK